MKAPTVYFDTSVFIGLLDNVQGRQPTALDIVKHEIGQGSKIHTSIMTVNEFIAKTYDKYHTLLDKNLQEKVDQAIQSIRDVAEIRGFDTDVAKEAARLLSVWGRKDGSTPELPRGKKHRWDCIHLATANVLKANRVYAWDDRWNDFPKSEISNIGEIISPAQLPAGSAVPLF